MSKLKIVGIGVSIFAGLFLIILAVGVSNMNNLPTDNLQSTLEKDNAIFVKEIDRLRSENNELRNDESNQSLDNEISKLKAQNKIDNTKKEIEIARLNAEIKKYELQKLNQEKEITKRCSLFCDSTGYQPKWAQGMGDMQSNSKCMSVVSDNYGSKDSNWCMEHMGKMMDDMN